MFITGRYKSTVKNWEGLLFGQHVTMYTVPISIENDDTIIKGEADPISSSVWGGYPHEFIITLNGQYMGILTNTGDTWEMNHPLDPDLVESLGNYLMDWYE